MSQFFDFAAETFRLQLEGMGSDVAPATPAMRGSPRPATDANPPDLRTLPNRFAAMSDADIEAELAGLNLHRGNP